MVECLPSVFKFQRYYSHYYDKRKKGKKGGEEVIASNYKVELKAKEKVKSVELGLGVREGMEWG